ncbi:MAG: serine/threonine protein kinase, partial [Gemmatimonadetes bacterium]|nr:serine/threonine protein kinase [Gemmatimonadota bacterium]
MTQPDTPRLTVEDAVAAFSDRYRIEDILGAGGMATVFSARDDKLGRKVAIKVLHPDLGATVGIERFMRETEITAGLNHPHIVPVLDRGEAGGHLYFVMSLIEGETLGKVLRRDGGMDPNQVLRLLRDIVDGLEHAHSLGVVHRDIKPENVLLSGRHAM